MRPEFPEQPTFKFRTSVEAEYLMRVRHSTYTRNILQDSGKFGVVTTFSGDGGGDSSLFLKNFESLSTTTKYKITFVSTFSLLPSKSLCPFSFHFCAEMKMNQSLDRL